MLSVVDSAAAVRPLPMSAERHYTVEEVAEMWNVSRDTARRIFLNEPGVMRITRPPKKYKRGYTTLRIPESVLNRVYARLCGRVAA